MELTAALLTAARQVPQRRALMVQQLCRSHGRHTSAPRPPVSAAPRAAGAEEAHYLQHKNHRPAVSSSPRAPGTKLTTRRFIASDLPSSRGEHRGGPAPATAFVPKERKRSSVCQPGIRMCSQGSCPRATCS